MWFDLLEKINKMKKSKGIIKQDFLIPDNDKGSI